jgi:hypothetical protein
MNKDFDNIKSVLLKVRSDYISGVQIDEINHDSPITERDIVAELYYRLRQIYSNSNLNVHCEIKPASSENDSNHRLRKLPRIDVGILTVNDNKLWISSAKKIQDRYKKGQFEARFSSIPIEFFHTAIEVKIQSNIRDAKDDIDLLKKIHDSNNNCNCFFVLLNARGRRSDHTAIQKYADENEICIIEYTCRK